MKNKLITLVSIIIIIINAFLPYYSEATGSIGNTVGNTVSAGTQKVTLTAGDKIKKESGKDVAEKSGTVVGNLYKQSKEPGNEANIVEKVLSYILGHIVTIPGFLITLVTNNDNESVSSSEWFSIQKLVFGKIALFDVDFFNVNTANSKLNSAFKQGVRDWYNITFRLSVILSLVVLIYIGIRMALASTAEGKVNYKKMFKDWVTSLLLLFLLNYGMIIVSRIASTMISLIPSSLTSNTFEKQVVEVITNLFTSSKSIWIKFMYIIIYLIFAIYYCVFFWKYTKRLLTMGCLVMIGPLITVTYSIDKVGDGRAQAYSAWWKMYIANAFMQPIHAIIYTLFMFSAGAIAAKVPILAALFLMGLSRGEKVARKMFGLEEA